MLSNHHIDKLDRAIELLDNEKSELWSDDPKGEAISVLKDLMNDLKAIAKLSAPIATLQDRGPSLESAAEIAARLRSKHSKDIRKKPCYKRSDAEFERFWSAVRMKVGKTQTRKAFNRMDEDVSVDYLIQKLEECQNYFLKRHGHLDYMPRPYTWLAMKRWEDEWGE